MSKLFTIEFFLRSLFIIQDNNLERAVDWIFNHPEEVNTVSMDVDESEQAPSGPVFTDGPGSENIAFYLVAPSLLLQYFFNAPSLLLHCSFVALSLLLPCFFILPSLLLPCFFILPSLLLRCFFIAPSLLLHCS